MGDGDGGSNTGVVAIVVIFLIVVVLAVLAWRGGLFGGRGGANVNIKVDTPAPATK